jgi:hypothetical protein
LPQPAVCFKFSSVLAVPAGATIQKVLQTIVSKVLMSGLRVKHVLPVVGALCGLWSSCSAFAAVKRPQHAAIVKPAPAVPVPQPLTLQELPASPPRVDYHNGELTIAAENSTLGDILLAVRTQTGASIDIPANATERVVSHLGPGPARQVLAELLNGTHFNYVMLGSASDPNAVAQVILTLRPPPSEAGASQAPAQTAVSPPSGGDMSNDGSDSDDDSDDATDSVPAPAPPAPVAAPQSNEPAVKTPQQLLDELRRQLEQQQNAPQGQPVPARPQ